MGTVLAEDRTSTLVLPLGNKLRVVVTHILSCHPLAVWAPFNEATTVDENQD